MSCSTLILHREYFPFMPLADSSPRGPLEIPVLEAQAPNGWWNESAAELFGAAKNISSLLHEASDCGADLMSPLVGFCAFNAAYMDLYIFRFPQMNLCRSPDAKLHLDYCLSYLEDFQHQWSIGESWIKTVKHASLLYERAAADKAWYQGSSRADLDILHQSIHEFRVVDRSDQQIREIEGAERSITSLTSSLSTPLSNSESDVSERNVTINDLLPEMVRHAQEQGTWAQGWPALGEVNLALFSG
ncbi:hypothetical protein N7510_007445 [Penicillium lagena]|uniref:uncharacterized protein n=1 Tax=Penicillium lagena TaxID=94218 RepID=UPI002540EAB1|nr:uncharacterized protein N7510_007445 [Penicillium lagena]KAJ5610726.1 hypothetical protein N7510_007445 [Penicillium lagena]